MSDRLKIVRIFIGSPGGLDEERRAAHEIVESVNRSHSERWGCHFKLLGWENVVPGYIRPQSKINEDLDRCDYFIGVLWNRWGSRPNAEDSGYTSGFEEEYERSKERIESHLMKDMAIYFKEVDVPAGMEPGIEIKKVLDFRRRCVEEKKVFFKPFYDVQSFRDLIREKLEEIGWSETELFVKRDHSAAQSKNPADEAALHVELHNQDECLLDEDARRFLVEITKRSSKWEAIDPHEVARIRLIGAAITRSGNDETHLGNHDANLIYQHLIDAPLSEQEIIALIDCGVEGFDDQNIPLWHWLVKHDSGTGSFDRLQILSVAGSESERKNAIRILDLLMQPISVRAFPFDRKSVLAGWFGEETANSIADAAGRYLASNGRVEDIPLLEETCEGCSEQYRNRVEGAIIGILSRQSVEAALKRLCARQVDKLDRDLIAGLFVSPQSLTTATLNECLAAKQDEVRLRAAQLLSQRDEVKEDVAQMLLTDASYDIRLIAAESLKRIGTPLDREVLKSVLTRESRGFGLMPLMETDTTYLDQYDSNRLAELSMLELEQRINKAGVFVHRELSVVYSKFRSQTQAEIRTNLADDFLSHFAARVELVKNMLGLNDESVRKTMDLSSFERNKLRNSALSALCALSKKSDLDLVRTVIDRGEIESSECVIRYLSRFGDWSDVNRILKMKMKFTGHIDFFALASDPFADVKADAIIALGQKRIADVLELTMETYLRVRVLKKLSQQTLSGLEDGILLRELDHKEDLCRKVFALRCVQSLPKVRLTALLNKYVRGERHRFYNSVHWLDLGNAFSSKIAKSIAARELASV